MVRAERDRERMREQFVEYRRTGDRRLRNALVEQHRPLACYLARRYANRGEPLDDLIQVACLGVLKVVERFDPERNLEFSTFASARSTANSSVTSGTRPGRSGSPAGPRSCTCGSRTR